MNTGDKRAQSLRRPVKEILRMLSEELEGSVSALCVVSVIGVFDDVVGAGVQGLLILTD